MMRVPPHSKRLERAMIAAILSDPDAWDATRGMLDREDFYHASYQAVYDAAVAVSGPGTTPTLMSVTERLDATGHKDLVDCCLQALAEEPLASAMALDTAKGLRRLTRRRRVLCACITASGAGYDMSVPTDEWLAQVESNIFAALQDDSATSGPQRIDMRAAIKRYEARALAAAAGKTTGLSSTIPLIDGATQGFGDGHLWVIGGRPGDGKTALMQQIATSAAAAGVPGLVFSLEMPEAELVDRSVASRGVSLASLRSGQLGQWHWEGITRIAAEMHEWPLYIDDTASHSIASLTSAAKLAVRRYGIRWIVVDYLQLMRGDRKKGDNREREVAEISGGLKALAKQLSLPVIVLSQFNRSAEDGGRRPRKSDFRESGAIEQDADGCILIWREPKYTTLIVDKNRHGPCIDVLVEFDGPSTTFHQHENQEAKRQEDEAKGRGGRYE